MREDVYLFLPAMTSTKLLSNMSIATPVLVKAICVIIQLWSLLIQQFLLLSIAWLLLLVPCLIDTAAAHATSMQGAKAVVDPYPLRPPDTSSPRDTLQSFLLHVDYIINAWRQGPVDARGIHNLINAAETLDFSTTPNGEAFSVQIDRMLLLKELLDRIELPSDDEIPGDTEVTKRGITRWTIPNTRITITQIKNGLRAGEFVFAAATVERLDAFYRLAKDLPYKPTATTPDIYENFVAYRGGAFLEEQLRNRLKEVDASSPRSTLNNFLYNVNHAYALVTDANARLKANPSQLMKKEILEIEAEAHNLLNRAISLLDLSQLPEAYRQDIALEAVLQLKEVLDRTLLPFLEYIPDAKVIEAARKRNAGSSMRTDEGYRWQYPNTEIEIVEVTEGEQRGQFLLSANTVRRASEFYEKVRDLPYRSDVTSADRNKHEWSHESRGFYNDYITSPGYLVPQAHVLGRLVEHLPVSFKALYGKHTLWQWIGLFICTLATIAGGVGVFHMTNHLAARLKTPLNNWVKIVAPVAVFFIVLQALKFIDNDINITGKVFHIVVAFGQVAMAILAVWAVFRIAQAISGSVIAMPGIREGSHDASLVRIAARIIAFLVGCLIIIYSFRNLGADMVPLLAGLGVGGLAIALAAQRTFANFIGSLILFANKPIRVGDFCRYGDQIGTVEHIGLLATRIRSLERTIVTVPNAEFSEMKIDNFAVRDQRLLKTVLQLRYETTSEQLRYILAKLRELLLGHPKITPIPARVRFVGYGAYSKDVEIFAYLDCSDHDIFLAIQEDILLRVEDIVKEAGSGFAIPSQTAYFTRDKGLDAARSGTAEARVGEWRMRGKLPFPEFDGEARHQLENILDYPPKGSPDYVPRKVVSVERTGASASTFSMDDLVNLPALAVRLRRKDRVAEYLQSRFSEETRALLSDYDGGRNMELKDALVHDLNEIILGRSIYDERRFSEVRLRQQTLDLLLLKPQGEELAQLNRFLLEDAFPKEFAINMESL